MKIVDGKPFELPFTCRQCQSKLIAEADDVKVGYFGPNYGGYTPEREYYVTCRLCGTDRILDYGKVPPSVREAADRKKKQ